MIENTPNTLIAAIAVGQLTEPMIRSLVSGESNDRFRTLFDGTMQWGAGGASALDVDLLRYATGGMRLLGDTTASLQISTNSLAETLELSSSVGQGSVSTTEPVLFIGTAGNGIQIDDGSGLITFGGANLDSILHLTMQGDLTLEALTQGSVLFIGPFGTVTEDNANFFWDDTADRLDIIGQFTLNKTTASTTGTDTAFIRNFVNPPGTAATAYRSLNAQAIVDTGNAQAINLVTNTISALNPSTSGANTTLLIGAGILGQLSGTGKADVVIGTTAQVVSTSTASYTGLVGCGLNAATSNSGSMAYTSLYGSHITVGTSHASAVTGSLVGLRLRTLDVSGFFPRHSAGTSTTTYMIQVGAWPAANGSIVYLTTPEQIRLDTITSGHIGIRQVGTIGQNRFASPTRFGADTAPVATVDITGSIALASGAATLTANAASSFTTSAGALTLDAAAALNLGATTATAVNIGNGTISTTVTGYLVGGRQRRSVGTAHVAGDYALSASWGAGATVSTVFTGANDSRFQITVTAGTTGRAANPTVTLTFKDGAWPAAPFAITKLNGTGTAGDINDNITWTSTTTTLVMTYASTPGASETFTIIGFVID